MFTIVEAPYFRRHWPRYWTQADYDAFVEFLTQNPNAGVTIPHSGGLRKIRWRRPGIGKSGGVRIIYFTRNEEGQLLLLTIYAKAVTDNLTAAQLKELRYVCEQIVAAQR